MTRVVLAIAALTTSLLNACAHAEEFQRPGAIQFGDSISEIEAKLDGLCAQQELRRIDPPFLPDVRDRQMQIDCEGFQFFGHGRHVEFVIRDDRLVMVWLIVTDAETQTMIDAMTRAYGAPTGRNGAYVAFERDRTAWRFQPAEILFYAPELDADMAPDFR